MKQKAQSNTEQCYQCKQTKIAQYQTVYKRKAFCSKECFLKFNKGWDKDGYIDRQKIVKND
jgi:hypothetical protein